MINRVSGYAADEENCQVASQVQEATISATFRNLVAPLEKVITKHPGACVASAFVVGVAVAWWIKRK